MNRSFRPSSDGAAAPTRATLVPVFCGLIVRPGPRSAGHGRQPTDRQTRLVRRGSRPSDDGPAGPAHALLVPAVGPQTGRRVSRAAGLGHLPTDRQAMRTRRWSGPSSDRPAGPARAPLCPDVHRRAGRPAPRWSRPSADGPAGPGGEPLVPTVSRRIGRPGSRAASIGRPPMDRRPGSQARAAGPGRPSTDRRESRWYGCRPTDRHAWPVRRWSRPSADEMSSPARVPLYPVVKLGFVRPGSRVYGPGRPPTDRQARASLVKAVGRQSRPECR